MPSLHWHHNNTYLINKQRKRKLLDEQWNSEWCCNRKILLVFPFDVLFSKVYRKTGRRFTLWILILDPFLFLRYFFQYRHHIWILCWNNEAEQGVYLYTYVDVHHYINVQMNNKVTLNVSAEMMSIKSTPWSNGTSITDVSVLSVTIFSYVSYNIQFWTWELPLTSLFFRSDLLDFAETIYRIRTSQTYHY